jgi:hypothetical protein
MTPQAPHGWPQPPRAPQHAAPHRPSTSLGTHASRALRLFAIAGTGAAGLCAVVGSVALVAIATGPARATHAAKLPAIRAPVVLAGHGSARTGPFRIGGNGSWTLRWSYNCTALGHRGRFVVSEGAANPVSGVSVSEVGLAGSGVTRTDQDAGTRYLVVSSRCAWTLRVPPQPSPAR